MVFSVFGFVDGASVRLLLAELLEENFDQIFRIGAAIQACVVSLTHRFHDLLPSGSLLYLCFLSLRRASIGSVLQFGLYFLIRHGDIGRQPRVASQRLCGLAGSEAFVKE